MRLAGFALAGLVFSVSAFAECGGSVQCIGVGATVAQAQANHHPGPDLGSANVTLAFGTHSTATVSASQTIFVEAVAGGSGQAVLGNINIGGTDAADFTITGGTCSPLNGPVHGGTGCTVTVAFRPLSAGATKSALVNIPLNPPCVSCIGGRSVAVTGTAFGPTVTAPRGDPSQDANVVALARAQTHTGLRFSRAQLANFHERMESLRGVPSTSPLALASAGATRGSAGEGGTGVWVGGGLQFGRHGETDGMNSLRFTTSGVSVGVDRRFGERLVLGVGVGFARDDTDIGTDGSSNKSTSQSVALYASFRPLTRVFLDTVLAYGQLDQDSTRFVPTANDFARASRSGRYTFGSLSTGYEYRREALLLSPYARASFTRVTLDEATETGAGANALTLFEQKVNARQFALGARAQSLHQTDFGWAQPKVRLEYVHDSVSEGAATVAFADQVGAQSFAISPLGTRRNSLLIGVGSDFLTRRGLKISFEYLQQRLPGPDSNQAIRFLVAKELDGRSVNPGTAYSGTLANPVNVEAMVTYDNNVNRAPDAGPKLSDHLYSLNAGTGRVFPVGTHARFVASGFFEGDKWLDYDGLDRASVGVQGELQYRTSAQYGAPTLGFFLRGAADDYQSSLRNGKRGSAGFNLRAALTDRIELFATLARNTRDADHSVFDTRDISARLNLDYALGKGTLYAGGELRRGDAVSSVGPGFESVVASKASARDDAYYDQALFAQRYDARTLIGTIGYNWPLGSRDSIDLSARHARAKPTETLGGTGPYAGGAARYTANQVSIAYLTRF